MQIAPRELARAMLSCPGLLRTVHSEIGKYTVQGDSVLDPMCGSGVLLAVAGKMRRLAAGFDIAPEMVEYANGLLSRHGCGTPCRVGDARRLPVLTGTFMMILSSVPTMKVMYSKQQNALERLKPKEYTRALCGILGEFRRALNGVGTCLLVQSNQQARLIENLARPIGLPVKFIIVPKAL